MSRTQPAYRQWIRDWSPGFLDSPEPDRLPPGATPEARNGWLTAIHRGEPRSAVLAKRPGSRLLNPAAIASGTRVDGLFEFRTSSGRVLMAICDGGLYEFDGVDTFTLKGGSSPWTAGERPTVEFFADNVWISDGTALKRWNGTALFDVGQVAPTGVTAMSAVSPTGTGLTGTYEARYTWYDPVLDHESSPSPITATVSLSNQARQHTQPSGTPGAAYTRWRAYVRRVDTNETKFTRVGTFVVGAGPQTEQVIDAARTELCPSDNDRNPPPGPWAILKQVKGGFFIGVRPNSSDYYVSRIGDPQSWNPKNVFSVRKGDGDPITAVKVFGEDVIVQKPHQSYRLVGDDLPFVLRPFHSSYGGVSQESGLEVDGHFYDWDRERGPYVTDGVTFAALADGRIRHVIDQVNRLAVDDIRCFHLEGHGLIGWAVPIGATQRKRMILLWSYLLSCWLPPCTGLEYGSFGTHTDGTGATHVYMGDEWGRVWQLFVGDREGPPGTNPKLQGVVASATASTVTVDGGGLYTTGSGLAGMPVAVRPPGGVWQWRRIASNTADTITLDTTHHPPFTETPQTGWEVVIGGIEWYHWSPWFDGQVPHLRKKIDWIYLQGRTTGESHLIEIWMRVDDETTNRQVDVSFSVGGGSALWGSAIWGASLWSRQARRMRKHRIDARVFSVQWGLMNIYPDQPVEITAFGFTGDVVERQVESV